MAIFSGRSPGMSWARVLGAALLLALVASTLLWPLAALATPGQDIGQASVPLSAVANVLLTIIAGLVLGYAKRNADRQEDRLRQAEEARQVLAGRLAETREEFARKAELRDLRAEWRQQFDKMEDRLTMIQARMVDMQGEIHEVHAGIDKLLTRMVTP